VLVFGLLMVLLGAGLVAIGLLLPMLEYAVVGGIIVLVGAGLVVAVKRGRKDMPPLA
jgi:hypothetical protein